jgi:multiple sugar transport system substrate-binding protein
MVFFWSDRGRCEKLEILLKRTILLTGFVALLAAGVVYFLLLRTPPHSPPSQGMRFVSLAWQERALATNHAIVDEWNTTHPDMPVEYVQGTWNSVHDYLITAFETGDVPDIFHYESSVIVDFAARGFLCDLRPMIEPEMKDDILDVAWESVKRPDGEISGIPFLLESLIGLYNRDLLDKAGISPPTFDHPWSWSELRTAAMKMTLDTTNDGSIDQWGVAIGLRNSANIVMNLSISFGGSFFRREHDAYVVRVGTEERELLTTIHDMLYVDRSTAPSSVGQSGPAMIPGFFTGKYAMLIGIGAWARQQLVENAPARFHWGVMPPLRARSQETGMSAQTLSIPKASKHKVEAMAFICFMLNRTNMSRLAKSDWMLPARKSCLTLPEFNAGEKGWDVTTASSRFLSTGPWLGAPGYIEWKNRVANPVLQEYFSHRLGLDEATHRIEEESAAVLSRYQQEQN